jgi:hypothetical protein
VRVKSVRKSMESRERSSKEGGEEREDEEE